VTAKPIPVPPVTFVRLEELPRGESVTALVYGGSKTGKTWFLGTAGPRTLYIDTGDGIETLRSPLFKSNVQANPIVVRIDEKIGPRGVPELADAYYAVTDAIDYALAHFAADFDTICVDEMTALRRFAMYRGMEYNQKMKRSTTLKKLQDEEMFMPAGQDFGTEMSLIEQFCVGYTQIAKSKGKNFLLAAHQRLIGEKPKDKDGNVIFGEEKIVKEIRPAVTGYQFPDTISALFDNVWRAERAGGGEGTVYRLRCLGDEMIVAGTRHAGVLPTVVRRPNFLTMLKHIRSGEPIKDVEPRKPAQISTPQPQEETANVPTVRA